MLHYYLQKGITPDKILSLSPVEQLFFYASAEIAIEERNEAINNMVGG